MRTSDATVTTDLLLYLVLVIATAATGGIAPAAVAAASRRSAPAGDASAPGFRVAARPRGSRRPRGRRRSRAQVILVDTPGIFRIAKRRLERAMVAAAWQGAEDADLVLLVIDSHVGPSHQDSRIIEMCLEAHKAVIVVANKIEFLPPGMRKSDVTPVGLAMTGDGKTAFVTLGHAAHVAVVDVASRKVQGYILVGRIRQDISDPSGHSINSHSCDRCSGRR